jgi:hypothetical protein
LRAEAEPSSKAAGFAAECARSRLRFPGDIIMTDKNRQTLGSSSVESVVAAHRRVQAEIDRKDQGKSLQEAAKPMQAGQREYPAGFPEQHLDKPGIEAELKLAPM